MYGVRCPYFLELVVVVRELENLGAQVRGKGLEKVQQPYLLEALVCSRVYLDFRSGVYLNSRSWVFLDFHSWQSRTLGGWDEVRP